MAVAFSAFNSNLSSSASGVIGANGTTFIRVKPNGWNPGDSTWHAFYTFGNATDGEAPSFQKYLDNNVYIGFNGGGHGDQRIVVADSNLFADGFWYNHVFTWADGVGCNYYVNNSSRGSTGTLTEFTAPHINIGNQDLSIGSVNAESSLAEFGIWNRVLAADELTILHATGTPLAVLNGLVQYYPLHGDNLGVSEIDWCGGLTVTPSGSLSFDDEPRVLRPQKRLYIGLPPGVVVPVSAITRIGPFPTYLPGVAGL